MADELFELKGRITLETKAVDKALKKLYTTLNIIKDSTQSASEQSFQGIIEGAKLAEEALDNDTEATEENTEATKKNEQQVKKTTSQFSTFLKQLKRIAAYRLIRTALKAIAAAFNEGINNLYQFSKITGNLDFAKSMDSFSTSLLYMKNSLGTAIAPIIQALVPLFNGLADAIAYVSEKISYFFALITGKDGYYKATKLAKEYAKVQNQILGFDELNVLNGSSDYANMFEWVTDFGLLNDLSATIKNFKVSIDNILPEGITPLLLGGAIVGMLTEKFASGEEGLFSIKGSLKSGLTASLIGVGLVLAISTIKSIIDSGYTIDDIEFWDKLEELALQEGIISGLTLALLGHPVGGMIALGVGVALGLIVERIKWGINTNEASNISSITSLLGNKNTQFSSSIDWSYLINGFADGGFPQQGTMFIAGEAGAEFVGNINGRTGVLNSTQLSAELSVANEGVVDTLVSVGNAIVSAINKKQTNISANDIRLAVGNNAMRYGV